MSKNKRKKVLIEQKETVELKHSRIELVIGFVGIALSLFSLVISIRAIALTKAQMDLDYNQNRPDLSMSAEIVANDECTEYMFRCKIKNDGGVIREAVIQPHLYVTFCSAPYFGAEIDKVYALEIKDAFAPYFGNGIYWGSDVYYNPDEHNWILETETDRMLGAKDLMFSIAEPLNADELVMCNVELYFELNYVDIMGEQQEEWYSAYYSSFYDIIEGDSEYIPPSQLRRIDKEFSQDVNTCKAATWINLGENMEALEDESIAELVDLCYEGLFGK